MNAAVTLSAQQITNQRRALIAAHDASETYHCNMASALRCQEDIEDLEADLRADPHDHEKRKLLEKFQSLHRDAVARAAAAEAKMPAMWAALTQSPVTGVSNGKTHTAPTIIVEPRAPRGNGARVTPIR